MSNKLDAALHSLTPEQRAALAVPVRRFISPYGPGLLVGRVLNETPHPDGGTQVEIKLDRPSVRHHQPGTPRTGYIIAPGEIVTFRNDTALGRGVEVQ